MPLILTCRSTLLSSPRVLPALSLIYFDDISVEASNYVGIGVNACISFTATLIAEMIEDVSDTFQTRQPLIVGFDDNPRTKRSMCLAKHLFFVHRVLIPQFLRLLINRAQLPLLQWIGLARDHALQLFFFRD